MHVTTQQVKSEKRTGKSAHFIRSHEACGCACWPRSEGAVSGVICAMDVTNYPLAVTCYVHSPPLPARHSHQWNIGQT